MSIAIRPTVKDDVQKLAEIQRLCDHHKEASDTKLATMSEMFGKLESDRFEHFTIIADEEIVGFVVYKRKGSNLFFRTMQEGEYYLQKICINPSRQGEGVAHSAIKVCELYLSDATAYYVVLPVDSEQDKKLYGALGFTDTGRREKVEKDLALALYEKRLLTEENNA